MWITDSGRINKQLTFFGTLEICLYRIEANDVLMIGGGMMHIGPVLLQQIKSHDMQGKIPSKLIIQHSHADHCGAVPFLKKCYPGLEVMASTQAAEIFGQEKVIQHIALTNKMAADKTGQAAGCAALGIEFEPFEIDRIIKEGDVIDLGQGIEAQIIEVPGHTRCSIAVYIPQLKMLFPSDAMAMPGGEISSLHYKPSPQYNYRLYRQSLDRLKQLDFDVLALEHYGVFTGDFARDVLQGAIEQTDRMRKDILLLHEKTHDLDKTVAIYLGEIIKKGVPGFLERDTALAAARAEVRSILRDAGLL